MAKSDHTHRRAPSSPSLTIHVPQEIIDRASTKDSRHCMIAETITAAVPNVANIIVDTATIRWTNPDKGLRYIYLTPHSVRAAIYRFDHGDRVEAFTFHLRSAQVRGVKTRDGSNKRITTDSWARLKDQIRKISSEKSLKLSVISNEMGIAHGTLRARLKDEHVPVTANVDKIEKWVLKHTGGTPAPRIKSQADKASGPARFRGWNPKKREQPEIIGGAHPPFDATLSTRQFGLRQLDWDTEQFRPKEH